MDDKSTFAEQRIKLSEPQRRSLEVTCCEMERLIEHSKHLREMAKNGDQQGAFLHYHATLNATQSAQLQQLERAALEQLMELRTALGMPPKQENLQHQLLSAFSLLWADLEDTRPARMVGYGDFNPAALKIWEPGIHNLIELCRNFVEVLQGENRSHK